MSTIEDRLREAYQGAAGTVRPESVRDIGQAGPEHSRPGGRGAARPRRLMIPVAAAAAVATVAVLLAVVPAHAPAHAPAQKQDGHGLPAASSAEPKFLVADPTGLSPLVVRNATTGAPVALVRLPTGPPAGKAAKNRRTISSVATSNGYAFVVAISRPHPCQTWLYQFQLNSRGQPGALTPFAALPTVRAGVDDMAISGNGQKLAYLAITCGNQERHPSYVGVLNIATRQATRWTIGGPGYVYVSSLSLTANGSLLCYSTGEDPSAVRIVPTSAAPGNITDRGRTLVQTARSGRSDLIEFADITPDGRAVYFAAFPSALGKVAVVDVGAGRWRVVAVRIGLAGLLVADPAVRYLLVHHQLSQKFEGWPRMQKLDLATGQFTTLPNALRDSYADITW